ncbi:GntR family transcriptional regulator [Spirillospora sp. CA-255316]
MTGPIYQQIAQQLRAKIESRELAPGAQLPTEDKLRETYNASRNTIRLAIDELAGEGLISKQPGRGTFVTEEIDPFVTTLTTDPKTGFGGGEGVSYMSEVRERRRSPSFSEPQVEIQRADETIAARLNLAVGDQVVSRHQQRFIDDRPYSLQTSWYPFRFVLEGATKLLEAVDVQPGIVRYLQEKLGIVQEGYQDLISVRPPNDTEINFFGLARRSGVSICEISRTAFDADVRPYRLTVTVYPSDRNRFQVNVGRVPGDAMTENAG